MRLMNGPQQAGMLEMLLRQTLSESDLATPFGCCNFFDDCSDGIFSLYYKGSLDLLDWMGFEVSDVCHREVDFINFVRPDTAGTSVGYIGDPCDDPNGVEFGACNLSVDDFGRYGRSGPERDLFKPKYYCRTRPRYFLDGSQVNSEADWDRMFAMDQLLNDIRVHLVTGNNTTAGQFDGLQRWVRTGYDCTSLDSYVVDWNGNAMAGGAGITINGAAIAATFDIVDVLLDLHRNVKQRISWSPLLRNQPRNVGDTILVMPSFMARCLLDFYTCWSVCPGAQYEEIVKNAKELREFRITLNGGLFGDGQISLDGETIPILAYDWGLINGPTTGDMYYLTGSIGAQRVWEGEHLSAQIVMDELSAAGITGGSAGFFQTDEGRVLGKVVTDNLCRRLDLWMRPRLWCMAPWAQVRIQDVQCVTPTGPLSPDPSETSFFPEDSFSVAECP